MTSPFSWPFLQFHTCQPREKFSRDKRRAVKRSELWKGVRGSSPGNLKKPALQMVQSELFLSYICQHKIV